MLHRHYMFPLYFSHTEFKPKWNRFFNKPKKNSKISQEINDHKTQLKVLEIVSETKWKSETEMCDDKHYMYNEILCLLTFTC